MIDAFALLAAAGAGLLGSGHCLGMCGGIVGALSLGVPPERRRRIGGLLPWQLAYNLGRVATYVALGALAGWAGATVGSLLPPHAARGAGRLLAALFLVGMGLYLLGVPVLLAPFERLGARLWRRIEPLGRRLLRPRALPHALALGAVWGLLPCGLVYSMLAVAAVAGGAGRGAATMAAFGAGTLPALLLAGLASGWFGRLARAAALRRLAAAAYLAAGLWLAATLVAGTPHRHGEPAPEPGGVAAPADAHGGDHRHPAR